MEPAASIDTIERSLRALVRIVLADPWSLSQDLGDDAVAELAARRLEEKRRRAPLTVPIDLLAYTHFFELRKIITKNWDSFSPALGKLAEFKVWADQIEDFRNAPAHSRELLPFERSLLEGIAGLMSTKVTAFRSEVGPDSNHYPEILTARDSFGLEYDVIDTESFKNIIISPLVLHPGDTVEFELTGVDAQERELKWVFDAAGRNFASKVGNKVSGEWTVQDSEVSRTCHITVTMSSAGKFHREKFYDHRVCFRYKVDPPE